MNSFVECYCDRHGGTARRDPVIGSHVCSGGVDRTVPFCRRLRLPVDGRRTRRSRGSDPARRRPRHSHPDPRTDYRPRRAAQPPAYRESPTRLGVSADGIRSLRGQAADGAEDIPATDGKETSGPEPRIEDVAAAELGLKEHDRLTLARQMMERRLVGRRSSSNLPELLELVTARALVSAGMIAQALEITPQAARWVVDQLSLREMTGRGRFTAWGVL